MATGSGNNTRFFNKLAAAARRRPAVVGAAIFATLVLAAARVAILLYFTPAENHMYSESLVRFRYAQMIMDGKAEPRVDYMVQWPEGFRRDEMILWLPDHMVGWSYRGWAAVFDAPKDQYTYLRYFMAAHSALYVPAALLLFGLMFRRFWPAWLAAALYLTCLPTFLRAAGNYLREDFATPPLLAAIALAWFLAEGGEASSRRRLWAAVGLGVMTLWSMSCWHMSQFYLNLVLGVTFLAALAGARGDFGAAGLAFLAGTVAAAALNKPLFVKGVMWSPTVAAALALTAWGFARRRFPGFGKRVVLAAATVALVGGSLALARGGAYNHAYALIFAKLRYVGVHPADPNKLPLDARLFWMGPYNTTTLRRALVEYGPMLFLAPAAFVWALVRGRRRAGPTRPFTLFPAATAAGSGVLYWLLVRLTIFFAPWAAALTVWPAATAKRRAAKAVWAGVAVAALAFQGYWIFNYGQPTALRKLVNLAPEPEEPLWDYGPTGNEAFGWLKINTPPGAAVLAEFGISASVMYWGERATALHPMFEVPEIRTKTVDASRAFMGTEEDLYRLCRRWRVAYVVYCAPVFLVYEPPGDRYYAATPNPRGDAAARKMQFAPQELKLFRLVYETYTLRIFEVGRPYGGYRAVRYHPYFDNNLFPDLPTSSHYYKVTANVRRALEHYFMATRAEGIRRYGAAIAQYSLALNLHPDYEDAEMRLGYCLVMAGRLSEAEPHFRRALITDPDNPTAHVYMGSYYLVTGQYGPGLAEYRRAAALAPDDKDIKTRLRVAEKLTAGG